MLGLADVRAGGVALARRWFVRDVCVWRGAWAVAFGSQLTVCVALLLSCRWAWTCAWVVRWGGNGLSVALWRRWLGAWKMREATALE